MKQEFLARAMGEIDDELLEEARRPLSSKRTARGALFRWAAAAACFAVICAAAVTAWPTRDTLTVQLGEATIWADGAAAQEAALDTETAALAMETEARQRTVSGVEIPLNVAVGGKEVTLTALDGALLDAEGGAVETLKLAEDGEVIWLVQPAAQNSFALTLRQGGRQVTLTASVTSDGGALLVTAKAA